MTEWLIRHFISSPDDVHKDTVRLEYGKLSSMTGIVCNILLFLVKFGIGMFSGAIAVTGDAFNNLTDAMACLITMFGYYFAARPADKDHPFGHGRLEYIFTQAIVFMIFAVGGTLLYNGVIHIMHPAEQTFHPVVFTVLLITIGVKFWLSRFNMTLGRKIDSVAMIATAADSRNDVLSTAIAALSMLLAGFIGGLPFDGIAAVLVALYILWSGFGIAKDVYSRMLGKPADRQLSEEIISILSEYDEILDVHDVIIHDYGSGVLMGSAHVGMDQEMRFVDAHDIADKAETEIRRLETIFSVTVPDSDPASADRKAPESIRYPGLYLSGRKIILTKNNICERITASSSSPTCGKGYGVGTVSEARQRVMRETVWPS